MFAALSGLAPARRAKMRRRLREMLPQGAFPARLPRGITGVEPEVERFGRAVDAVNRLRPAFVIGTGDLVHDVDRPELWAAFERAAAGIAPDIPAHWLPGNHDLAEDGGAPTPDALSEFRARVGDDYYAFSVEDTLFLALNSESLYRPEHMPQEAARQFEFIEEALTSRRRRESRRVVAFMHTPLFWRDPRSGDAGTTTDGNRLRLLKLFRAHDVSAVFAGHLHHNRCARDGEMQMVASGPVGFSFLPGGSGYRVVRVADSGITHDFKSFDSAAASRPDTRCVHGWPAGSDLHASRRAISPWDLVPGEAGSNGSDCGHPHS